MTVNNKLERNYKEWYTKVQGKVIPVHPIRSYGGGGDRRNAPLILNLGARWRGIISMRPQLLYPRGRNPVPFE
jgi:hypothetical protein